MLTLLSAVRRRRQDMYRQKHLTPGVSLLPDLLQYANSLTNSQCRMSKLVPQVLRRFDFELTHPDREWVLHDYWFVTQTGLDFKVKARHQ